MSVLAQLAATFGLLSLLSVGGANATIPEIHRQVVLLHHWMDDATFAKLVALAQAAPGPNVLIVSLIGWQVAGLLGLLVASVTIVTPSSLLALGVARLMTTYEDSRAVPLLRRALAPIAVGLMFASAIVMAKAAYAGLLTGIIAVAVAGTIVMTRLSPVWAIAGGAGIGIVAHRLNLIG